jgi:hypothetical protein
MTRREEFHVARDMRENQEGGGGVPVPSAGAAAGVEELGGEGGARGCLHFHKSLHRRPFLTRFCNLSGPLVGAEKGRVYKIVFRLETDLEMAIFWRQLADGTAKGFVDESRLYSLQIRG